MIFKTALGFITIFVFHISYSFFDYYKTYKDVISFDIKTFFLIYLKQQDYFLGLSYAILFSFMVYSFLKFKEGNKTALKGVFGSGIIIGIISLISCFVLRICSGCLPVYCMSCPLSLGYTLSSITAGVFLIFIGEKLFVIKKIYIFLFTIIFLLANYSLIKNGGKLWRGIKHYVNLHKKKI